VILVNKNNNKLKNKSIQRAKTVHRQGSWSRKWMPRWKKKFFKNSQIRIQIQLTSKS